MKAGPKFAARQGPYMGAKGISATNRPLLPGSASKGTVAKFFKQNVSNPTYEPRHGANGTASKFTGGQS